MELTEQQETEFTRRTALIYFQQYVDGGMIGFTGDEDDLPSDREMNKRLKAYAQTLTTNRLTGWEGDGWTMYFKEVVEVEFDYFSGYAMWQQSDLDGVKPQYCSDDVNVTSMKLKSIN